MTNHDKKNGVFEHLLDFVEGRIIGFFGAVGGLFAFSIFGRDLGEFAAVLVAIAGAVVTIFIVYFIALLIDEADKHNKISLMYLVDLFMDKSANPRKITTLNAEKESRLDRIEAKDEYADLPPSASSLFTNALGFVCCMATLVAVRFFVPDIDILALTLLAMVAAILPIMIIELLLHRVYERPSAGLQELTETNLERVAVKVVGLLGTLGFLAFLYWVIPEYHKDTYDRYFTFLQYSVPWLALLSIPYFWWMDGRMKQPEDAYYQMGLMVMLQWDDVDIYLIGRHIRNWLVKAFFLPLMFTYTGGNAMMIVKYDFANMDSFGRFFEYANNLIFFADLIFACVGYVMTFRFLDSHIRSSEPTFRGWIVAVMCYAPLWQTVFYGNYFNYDDNISWGSWLNDMPSIYILWGMLILTLEVIYASATISLGYRFSNLTYRGLVANGAYRFTKHPAYVSKNLSWWLISVPFISNEGIGAAITHCTLLFGVNLIYYLRAKTEENHLSHYPEYVEYALMMNERSIFAPLTKWLPFLKYKAPTQPLSNAQDKV